VNRNVPCCLTLMVLLCYIPVINMIDLLLKICMGFLLASVASFGVWAGNYIVQEQKHKTEQQIIKSKFSKTTLALTFALLGLGIVFLAVDVVFVLIALF